MPCIRCRFVLLLGIIAGFVEQLVPSLLDEQANKLGNSQDAKTDAEAHPGPGTGWEQGKCHVNRAGVTIRPGLYGFVVFAPEPGFPHYWSR